MSTFIVRAAVAAAATAVLGTAGYFGFRAYQRRKLAARRPIALLPAPSVEQVEAAAEALVEQLAAARDQESLVIDEIAKLDSQLDLLEAAIKEAGASMPLPTSAGYVEFQADMASALRDYNAMLAKRAALYTRWEEIVDEALGNEKQAA